MENTELYKACRAHDIPTIRRLLLQLSKETKDTLLGEQRNQSGCTPLHVAIMRGFVDVSRMLLEAAEQQDREMTEEGSLEPPSQKQRMNELSQDIDTKQGKAMKQSS